MTSPASNLEPTPRPAPSKPSENAPRSAASSTTPASNAAASSTPTRPSIAELELPFGTGELAIALSHYDLGAIESIQAFPRGSRKAPKVVIKSGGGLFLLKRRGPGKDDPYKVAFCHALQLHLAQRQFPLPHLIGTRRDNNSMHQRQDHIYELFEFIHGVDFDQSLEATADAGKTLALFHKLLSDFESPYDPPGGSYHGARQVVSAIKRISEAIGKADPPPTAMQSEQIETVVKLLNKAYRSACTSANELGLKDWPGQIVHSDWHPGNMLFRGPRVVAVIDYDSARRHPRVLDIANGALQFSILGGGPDPGAWPDGLDFDRFRAFVQGYDTVPECVISRAEIHAIPHLMIEALIAEAALPLAATGRFNQFDPLPFLGMLEHKIRWLLDHRTTLIEAVEG